MTCKWCKGEINPEEDPDWYKNHEYHDDCYWEYREWEDVMGEPE